MRDLFYSQFVAGGVAGMISRTAVAPIDRVKILMQTEKITSGGKGPSKYNGVVQSLRAIAAEASILLCPLNLCLFAEATLVAGWGYRAVAIQHSQHSEGRTVLGITGPCPGTAATC